MINVGVGKCSLTAGSQGTKYVGAGYRKICHRYQYLLKIHIFPIPSWRVHLGPRALEFSMNRFLSSNWRYDDLSDVFHFPDIIGLYLSPCLQRYFWIASSANCSTFFLLGPVVFNLCRLDGNVLVIVIEMFWDKLYQTCYIQCMYLTLIYSLEASEMQPMDRTDGE